MRLTLLLSFVALSIAYGACTTPQPPLSTRSSSSLPTVTFTATFSSTRTPTPQPPPTTVRTTNTPQPFSTPTVRWQVDVVEFVPAIYPDVSTPERDVQTAFWMDDNHFIYGFVDKGPDILSDQPLQWMAYDLMAWTELAIPSPMRFDESFWKRNNVEQVNRFPELTGHFSPSGKYVAYNVSYGSHFDQNSRTEIWVAETHGQGKFKVREFGYAGVSIGNIAWFDDEKKILFALGYEGPGEFYVTDIPSRTTTPLNVATEFSSELSPDGTTLAFIPSEIWRLSLFSLQNKSVQAVEQSGGREPH